ncbi:Uncharacterised protein [Vibrio cholerae]|nr:Uncharacterised protein [Vibrio cholerae]
MTLCDCPFSSRRHPLNLSTIFSLLQILCSNDVEPPSSSSLSEGIYN